MNTYTRQKRYLSKALQVYKRVTLWVPKSKEDEIKTIAKEMREILNPKEKD